MRPAAVLQSDAPATFPQLLRRRRLIAALLLACLAAAIPAATAAAPPSVPKGFFGIAPQTGLSPADATRMRSGGIESVRVPVSWAAIQPTAKGGYDWSSLDQTVAVAARARLQVLPFLYGTPRWLARKPTTLPVDTGKQRAAWAAFLQAAVGRYGPGGTFWDRTRARRRQVPAGDPQPDPDPHLADLERGQLLLLRLPGLAAALREAGEDLRPGDQSRRPAGEGDPLRPVRQTDRDGRARDARRHLPQGPLPGAGAEGRLRRRRPAPLRGRHRNAGRTGRRRARSDRRKPRQRRPLHHRDGLGLPERLQPGRLRAGDPGPGQGAARRLRLPARKPAPPQPASRSTGSPGRTSRATATSATRSASSTKARASSPSRPGTPSWRCRGRPARR